MKIAALFFALVALVAAEVCKFDESKYLVERRGPRSKAEDDAEAIAKCLKGESIIRCECERFASDKEPCDGTMIRETAAGFFCVAKNNALGKGVVAKATCARPVIVCESEYGNMPSISCPKHFRPTSCTMHTSFMHQYNPGKPVRPVSKRSGNKCYTSKGCENCRVQAICIRATGL